MEDLAVNFFVVTAIKLVGFSVLNRRIFYATIGAFPPLSLNSKANTISEVRRLSQTEMKILSRDKAMEVHAF